MSADLALRRRGLKRPENLQKISTYHQGLVVAPFQDSLASLIDRRSDACHAAGPLHSVTRHPEWYRGVRSRSTELLEMPLKASFPQPCRVMAAIYVNVSPFQHATCLHPSERDKHKHFTNNLSWCQQGSMFLAASVHVWISLLSSGHSCRRCHQLVSFECNIQKTALY